MRHCPGGAAEAHVAADVVPADVAEGAPAAGQANLEGDAVAGPEALGVGPGGDHDAARLVAQRQRLLHQDVAVAVVREVVQVRAAQARRLDGDVDLVGGEGG